MTCIIMDCFVINELCRVYGVYYACIDQCSRINRSLVTEGLSDWFIWCYKVL